MTQRKQRSPETPYSSTGQWHPAHQGRLQKFDPHVNAVYAFGLTYADHLKEVGEKADKPVLFVKSCTPTPGATSVVYIPGSSTLFQEIRCLDTDLAKWLEQHYPTLPCLMDYEVEIGIVVLEDISDQQLRDPNFNPRIAYILANDLTARSVQIAGEIDTHKKLEYWQASKSFTGFLPTGHQLWIPDNINIDEMPDFTLETYVNGELRQRSSSDNIIYSPREMLKQAAEYSPDKQLHQNDLILTGTPAGVGLTVPSWKRRLAALLPPRIRILLALRSNIDNPRLLRSGDTVTVRATKLGTVETKVITKSI